MTTETQNNDTKCDVCEKEKGPERTIEFFQLDKKQVPVCSLCIKSAELLRTQFAELMAKTKGKK